MNETMDLNSANDFEPHASEPAAPVKPAIRSRCLEFSGSGSEYFRIWVVNLLLSLCTLGIYSAWAKVRKTRYFYQNTRLDGHAFDYHGNPKAILRGRIIAVILFAAYSWAFDISRAAGYVTIGILCVVGPLLFLRALQFKLRNSSWRGMRLGFTASTFKAYLALFPLLILWFSSALIGLFIGDRYAVGAVTILTLLCIPWMHHALKRFQHSHFRFGELTSKFEPARGRFYATYLKAFGLVVLVALLASLVAGVAFAIAKGLTSNASNATGPGRIETLLFGLSVGGLAYLIVNTFAAVRIQRTVWTHTQLGLASFDVRLRATTLSGLIFKSVILGLLTLGLYWPYATIAIAKYRIENVEITSPADFAETISVGDSSSQFAAGEGAMDLFGIDIGL